MSTYRRLIGLPVIALADGTRLGTVRHLVVDSGRAQVVGFALDDGRWWRPSPVLLLRDAVGLAGEVVTTRERGALVDACSVPDLERLLSSDQQLLGRQVVRTDGSLVGVVTDFSFDPRSGRIASLEVSSDCDDAAARLQLVAYQQVQVMGPDAVVIAVSSRPDVRPGQGAERAEQAEPRAAGAPGSPAHPAPSAATTTGADLVRLFQERQERFLLGKVAQRPVHGPERDVIVEAGQAVTPELLARVKEAGKLLELTASVSMRRDAST